MNRISILSKNLVDKFKSFSLKKKILIVAAIVIGFFIVSGVIANFTKKPDYTVAKAERADITEEVVETGQVVATGNVAVSSPTNGIVEEVYVANGDEIIEGADIAK